MQSTDDDWELVKLPKKQSPYIQVYGKTKKCIKVLYKAYTIGYNFNKVICRLVWITFTLSPWCSPKIALCTSLVVFMIFIRNLRKVMYD